MAKPFTLSTSVSTGHTANIFSTKFMPHSNDRTVITCAGDAEVRVFDIERGGASGHASEAASEASTRSTRFNRFFPSATFLNDGNTNARVYRSHADRVKRIVTESSPHLFLTCSEDGEVRQWDLRQPSSAYPAPRGGQGFMSYRYGDEHDADNAPPPLISYKKYQLDLNTISCSPTQPHYIALGGAHLHCFLHDRRMLGRNMAEEQGRPSSLTPEPGTSGDELMGQATRCVKRFAPKGKPQMSADDNGHITACKISDANPNEMIVSWSGDHIYSFDLVQSPDARDAERAQQEVFREAHANRVRQSKDRKRKRQAPSQTSLGEPARARMAVRQGGEEDEGEISLRVRYGNGQSENISLNPPSGNTAVQALEQTRETLLTESQNQSHRVARMLVKLRKTFFDFKAVIEDATNTESSSQQPTNIQAFSSALDTSTALLHKMHRIMTSWRYPVNPTREEVAFQQTLRRNRQSASRFVQAAGTLSRVLGGELPIQLPGNVRRSVHFQHIGPAPLERDEIDTSAQFALDFLRAILLWLEGGRDALVHGFRKPNAMLQHAKRFPLSEDDGEEAIESKLINYLSDLASDKPVVNVDASRFEVDENRIVFETQSSAVLSFARAVGGYDLDWKKETRDGPNGPLQKLDRGAATRFWGVKVGRSLLMTAGEGINYEHVNRAFGGINLNIQEEEASDSMDVEREQEDIDVDELDPEVEQVELQHRRPIVEDTDDESMPEIHIHEVTADGSGTQQQNDSSLSGSQQTAMDTTDGSARSDTGGTTASSMGVQSTTEEHEDSEDDDDDEGNDDDDDDDDEDDEDGGTFEYESDESGEPRVIFRSSAGFGRSRQRAGVEMDKPCSTHTRVYKGHCNVKTVKDVNFYGLNDEYVISGSDDGNFFIWDKKTTKLLNILEGDGEVVNVIQGHPYEPLIATSGIDNTIKIFSPDARLQEEARNGTNIANPGGVPPSSLRLSRRMAPPSGAPQASGLTTRRRADKMYEIISNNDTNRQGGVGDAYLTVSLDMLLLGAWLRAGRDIT